MLRKNAFGLLLSMMLLLTGCTVQPQGAIALTPAASAVSGGRTVPPTPTGFILTPTPAAQQAYPSPLLPAATISGYPVPGPTEIITQPPPITNPAYPPPAPTATAIQPPALYKPTITAAYVPLAGAVDQNSIDPNVLDYFFVDDLHGWVSTKTGLLATDDGGESWQEQADGKSFDQIDFVSTREGFATQGTGLLHTVDAGRTWQPLPGLDPPDYVKQVDFIDRLNGWAATSQLDLLRSRDGGMSWQLLKSPCPIGNEREKLNVTFVDAGAGWAVCLHGGPPDQEINALYRTLDGGNSWDMLAFHVSSQFLLAIPSDWLLAGLSDNDAPSFSDRDHGWITGGFGWLFTTDDGGISWRQSPEQVADPFFYHPQQISRLKGYVLAKDGTLLKTDDGGENWLQILPKFYPDQTSYLDAQNGFGVGGEGSANVVYRTYDGGHTWNAIGALPRDVEFTLQVQFVDTLHGWDISDDFCTDPKDCGIKTLYRTGDGGQTWEQLWPRKDSGISIGGVFFTNPSEGYLTSDDGRELYFSQDGGESLAQIQGLQGAFGYSQPQFINLTAGYAIRQGHLYGTQDETKTWKALDTGCEVSSFGLGRDGSLWILSGDCRSAPAYSAGKILISIDGGHTWQPIAMPGMDVEETHFVDSKHGWLRGGIHLQMNKGIIFGNNHNYVTVDGGSTWTQLN